MSEDLSVCCMTSGRRPKLLAGILTLLRDVADEIVVAIEEPRAELVHAAVSGVADRLLTFPPLRPADRPIAWLFRSCNGRWIFNIDDDEVPSPELIAELPRLVRRNDITHASVARRWLYPTPDTYLAEAPWNTEFQLRFCLADDRCLQFGDVFHRPVICHGPGAFVDAPLWHLDTALNPLEGRLAKARAYDLERPGMRLGGIAHNVGVYVPERVEPEPATEQVGPADRAAITAATDFEPSPSSTLAPLTHATREQVDLHWPGPPYPEGLYRGRLTIPRPPKLLTSGLQQTIDVVLENQGDSTWRWGPDARPEVRLGYRFGKNGHPVDDPLSLRTTLPADLAPGASLVAPLHVVAPQESGDFTLELDLIHEHVRWFGIGAVLDVEVRERRQVAVIGHLGAVVSMLEDMAVSAAVEPVVVLRDPVDRGSYGDFRTVPGVRRPLLEGTAASGPLTTLIQLFTRSIRIARAASGFRASTRAVAPGHAPLLAQLSESEALIVTGPNWEPDAAQGREWWVVVTTAIAARRLGVAVVVPDSALPSGGRVRDAVVRRALGRLRTEAIPPLR